MPGSNAGKKEVQWKSMKNSTWGNGRNTSNQAGLSVNVQSSYTSKIRIKAVMM